MSDSELFIPFKILVVEFEDRVRAEAMSMLSARGFEMLGEKQAHNTQRTMETFEPELLMISLDLPRLAGIYLIRKLREDDETRRIPIIALGSRVDKRSLAKLQDFDVKDILTVPLDDEKTFAAVERYYKIKVISEITRED